MKIVPKTKIVRRECEEIKKCENCQKEIAVTYAGFIIEVGNKLIGTAIDCSECGLGQYRLLSFSERIDAKKLASELGLTDESTKLPPHAVYGLFPKTFLTLQLVPAALAPITHISTRRRKKIKIVEEDSPPTDIACENGKLIKFDIFTRPAKKLF